MKTMRKQAGFGLIEVLVAFLILTIGLLGMVSLQNKALYMSNTSYLYSQAVFLADDLLDRMRSNRDSLIRYQMSAADPLPAIVDCSSGAAADCEPDDIADHDKALWLRDLQALLPSGQADVTVSVDNEVTVVIQFDDERDTSDLQSYTVRTRI